MYYILMFAVGYIFARLQKLSINIHIYPNRKD